MSMLDRYRKAGGFNQLLLLMETCGTAKQEKFIDIIHKEDAAWADELRSKMIDFNRIMSWNSDTLTEVFGTLQDLTISTVLHGCTPELMAKVQGFFTHARWRKIDDLVKASKPTAGEITSMQLKIVESVRKMAIDHQLRFDKFAPELIVEDGIEDRLAHTQLTTPLTIVSHHDEAPAAVDLDFGKFDVPTTGDNAIEMQALKKKVGELSKDNAVLRHEVSILKSKLEQIRKIA